MTTRIESMNDEQLDNSGLAYSSDEMLHQVLKAMHGYLLRQNLVHYRLFVAADLGDHALDDFLQVTGLKDPPWLPMPATPEYAAEAVLVSQVDRWNKTLTARREGILPLPEHKVIVGRRVVRTSRYPHLGLFTVVAAESFESYQAFHARVRMALRWRQVIYIGGTYQLWKSAERFDPNALDHLHLPTSTDAELREQVLGFFNSPNTAERFDKLGIPCRRYVMVHGPSKSGKSRTCQALVRMLPSDVAVAVYRARDHRGETPIMGLQFAICEVQAAARRVLLFYDDIDLLMGRQGQGLQPKGILRMFDKILMQPDSMLCVLATTKYSMLLPALTGRPGAFHPIELYYPDKTLRSEYLARRVPDTDPQLIRRITEATPNTSYRDLKFIVRHSGWTAAEAGRSQRSEEDWLEAVKAIQDRTTFVS
jgi:hypothetical protein